MRIAAVSVQNFRGIRRLELENLSDIPVVTVAGANGSGKSVLLEAVVSAWKGQIPKPAQQVGSWGDAGSIRVTLALDETEREAVAAFSETHVEVAANQVIGVDFNKRGNSVQQDANPQIARTLRNVTFQEQNPFARVDLLPADRTIPRGEAASVNAALLSDQQAREFRDRVFSSLANRQIVQLQGVQSFLASLDYLELIADRQQDLHAPRDFQLIADSFQDATGKTIHRPQLDAQYGARLKITTPSGADHGVDELSSGEQEVLGLMYYVRRLSAQGGVLLIDEPELHLHPALQRSLFSVIQTLGERSQAWVVTHAPKLVAMSDLRGLVRMQPPSRDGGSQAQTMESDEARLRLQEELGITAADLLQSAGMCVVEGPTDADLLQKLFPIETGRLAMHPAGSASAVEAVAATMTEGPFELPWLAIRDRDLMSDGARNAILSDRLFVWKRRMLENEILHPPLIAAALQAAGGDATVTEVETKLKAIADRHRDHIERELVETRLKERYEHGEIGGDTPIDKLRSYLEAAQETARRKAEALDQVIAEVREELNAEWDQRWLELMDGKRGLGEFVAETPFDKRANLVQALVHQFRENPDLASPGLKELRERLTALLAVGTGT